MATLAQPKHLRKQTQNLKSVLPPYHTSHVVSDNETDFDEDQYPPAEDKYKQLEDQLSAMEVQKVPRMDFGDLGLSSGVVISHKFKAPVLYPKICPPIFFKNCKEQASKSPQGLHSSRAS